MAAALLRAYVGNLANVDSAGVYEGWLDPFVQAVMGEEDIALDSHEPKSMKSLDLSKFDVIIALTPQALKEAQDLTGEDRIEFWDIINPSNERGARDAVLAAYRAVKDELKQKISTRFDEFDQKP